MTTILRNSDNNKIKVIYFSKPKYIRKISFNKKYFRYLNNEIKGLKWYSKICKKKNDLIKFNNKDNIFYLDIKFFEGEKNIFYKSIVQNESILNKAIDHYVDVWPRKKKVRCHGDLTIDNIIYSKNSINFIDWELSGLSKEVWGYDLLYLLISSIFFSYDIKNKVDKNEKIIFQKLWNKLKKLNISKTILSDPISFFKKIHKKKNWRDAISDHPNKIYPISINNKFKITLKELIR
jgi:thiamine kinase-like enzyme